MEQNRHSESTGQKQILNGKTLKPKTEQMIIETNNIPPTLSGGTLKILCAVASDPGCSCTDVAEQIGITTAGVTAGVDVAETCQLILRIPHQEDRRKWSLQLTDIGEAMVKNLQPEGAIA